MCIRDSANTTGDLLYIPLDGEAIEEVLRDLDEARAEGA